MLTPGFSSDPGLDSVHARREAITTGRLQRYEHTAIIPGLGERRLLRIVSPMPSEDGVCHEALELTLDVTEERRKERALVQSEKLSALGTMIAGIAHELNNPLGAILASAQMIDLDADRKALADDLQVIEEAARRCTGIVKNLLLFARQASRERQPLDLGVIVERAVEMFRYEFRTGGIEVRCEVAPDLSKANANDHEIIQVLVNLLNNARQAIRHAGRPGAVTVTVRPDGDRIAIVVEDDGPGIAPEHLGRIFEPFFTTKIEGEGTGLGLSVSYGIVKDHGGEIHVESELGHGARFTVLLPTCEEPVVDLPPPPTAKDEAKIRGARILVVDDEAIYIDLVRRMLAEAGHAVDGATRGEQALGLAARTPYDLVLCDMRLPGMHGRDIYDGLCKLSARYAERVVFCTGDVLGPGTQTFIENARIPRLAKPFQRDELIDLVRSMLREAARVERAPDRCCSGREVS